MPRYFFDIHDGSEIPDLVGPTWADDLAAQNEAVRVAGEIMREMPSYFRANQPWTVEVLDEHRNPRYKVRFSGEAMA